jgi:hypothetical protein
MGLAFPQDLDASQVEASGQKRLLARPERQNRN